VIGPMPGPSPENPQHGLGHPRFARMGLVRGAIPENCIDEVVVPSQTHETLCIQEVGVTAGIAVALWGVE